MAISPTRRRRPATAIKSYLDYLETDLAPRAKASFRLGRERFERKLKLEDGVELGSDRLLAIALRELAAVQEEFRKVAGRLNGGDPVEAWRSAKEQHPAPGELISVAEAQVGELEEFLRTQDLVSLPDSEPVVVAPSPDFYRWAFASMWTPGPFESKPSRAYYYLTDVDRSWPPDRQKEHLRDFNIPTLWNISIHEVYPGHFLHFRHLRQVDSKVRKSTLFAPASFVEGWAHYCEHMMVEAGFRRGDVTIRLGQLAEALVRLARFVVAIRLHCEDLSVEQGMRFFRDEAFLEETTARREAERGTFDPTYLVYSLGKLMMLKLRRDYKEQQGGKYSLRSFHDAVLSQGSAPFWALRRLLLDETVGRLAGVEHATLRIRVRGLPPALRGHQEVLGSRAGSVHALWRGTGAAAAVVTGDSVQGSGWYITDYSQKGKTGGESDGHVRHADSKPAAGDDSRCQRRRQTRTTPAAEAGRPQNERSVEDDASTASCPDRLVERVEIAPERIGELRPPQCEVGRRLQKPEFVAGVMPHTCDLARIERTLFEQPPHARW